MSVTAPARQLTRDELVDELRAVLAWHIARAEAGDGVVLCSGLGDTDTEAALYRYALVDRSPAALAAVHAAAERRIADILHG
ncbi:hypothetical protein ASE48_22545 [Mycobacterium sp. Root265]|uniref:hypothetical protein n=1 Tax=Mycobacterium sp. Root265 TaxID=1736504 RepID=UPI00070FB9F9|nr:hypothetical protein [Mycobacterium sp. Root265]KRD19805.1 hypothetical protein ASE48_22545 [Mycobacterium sp. Root265]